jgi:hypothetical protein
MYRLIEKENLSMVTIAVHKLSVSDKVLVFEGEVGVDVVNPTEFNAAELGEPTGIALVDIEMGEEWDWTTVRVALQHLFGKLQAGGYSRLALHLDFLQFNGSVPRNTLTQFVMIVKEVEIFTVLTKSDKDLLARLAGDLPKIQNAKNVYRCKTWEEAVEKLTEHFNS